MLLFSKRPLILTFKKVLRLSNDIYMRSRRFKQKEEQLNLCNIFSILVFSIVYLINDSKSRNTGVCGYFCEVTC